MINENVKLKGTLTLVLRDETTGEIKENFETNRVVDGGLAHITSRLKDASAAAMGWIAIGTANTNDNDTQTLLGAEIARVATSTPTFVTTTTTNDSIQYVATFAAGVGTGTIVEAGIFNVVTANSPTMLCRSVFGAITKGANDSLTITWKVVVA